MQSGFTHSAACALPVGDPDTLGNGVTAVDPGGNNYVIVTAQMDTAGVDVSVVYDQIIRWTGGAPGAAPGTRKLNQPFANSVVLVNVSF